MAQYFAIFSILLTIFVSSSSLFDGKTVRLMSFNTWIGGKYVENGLAKVAKHIAMVDADIVALQEIRPPEIINELLTMLNRNPQNGMANSDKWKAVFARNEPYPDTVILTKHGFVPDQQTTLHFMRSSAEFLFSETPFNELPLEYTKSNFATGTTVVLQPEGKLINVFNVHLEYRSDGMAGARNKLITRPEQLMAGERSQNGHGRVQNIEQMLNDTLFRQFMHKSKVIPLIVIGDFNTASHLDWTEGTKNEHGGWAFQWPSTKVMTDAGFVDSYRQLRPDPKIDPGITWSTNRKFVGPEWDWTVPEPQDRIDYIFYRPNAFILPIRSFTYSGQVPELINPIPNHWHNDWPSDHWALVTDFELLDLNGTTR